MKNAAKLHSIVNYKNHHGFVTSFNKESCSVFNFETEQMNNIPSSEVECLFHFDNSIFQVANEKKFCMFAKDFFNNFIDELPKLKRIFNLHEYESGLDELIETVTMIEEHMATLDRTQIIFKCYNQFKNYISNTVFLTSKITQSELGYDDFSTKDIKNLLSHLE